MSENSSTKISIRTVEGCSLACASHFQPCTLVRPLTFALIKKLGIPINVDFSFARLMHMNVYQVCTQIFSLPPPSTVRAFALANKRNWRAWGKNYPRYQRTVTPVHISKHLEHIALVESEWERTTRSIIGRNGKLWNGKLKSGHSHSMTLHARPEAEKLSFPWLLTRNLSFAVIGSHHAGLHVAPLDRREQRALETNFN